MGSAAPSPLACSRAPRLRPLQPSTHWGWRVPRRRRSRAAFAALNAAVTDGSLAESGSGAETGATKRMTAPTVAGAGAGAGAGGFLVVRGGVAKDEAFEDETSSA
jgi:hypothetical protein